MVSLRIHDLRDARLTDSELRGKRSAGQRVVASQARVRRTLGPRALELPHLRVGQLPARCGAQTGAEGMKAVLRRRHPLQVRHTVVVLVAVPVVHLMLVARTRSQECLSHQDVNGDAAHPASRLHRDLSVSVACEAARQREPSPSGPRGGESPHTAPSGDLEVVVNRSPTLAHGDRHYQRNPTLQA